MGFDLWAPLNWEQGQLLRQQNLRSTTQQYAQKTSGPGGLKMVSALLGNRRMYPWMQPGAQASLGLSGIDAASEAAQLAARTAAQAALETGQWATQGQYTDGTSEQAGAVAQAKGVFAQNVAQQMNGLQIGRPSGMIPSSALPGSRSASDTTFAAGLPAPRQAPSPIPQATQPAPSPFQRGGLGMSPPRHTGGPNLGDIADVPGNVAQMLTPGGRGAPGVPGVVRHIPQAIQVAQQNQAQTQQAIGQVPVAGGALKTVARTGFLAANAPFEAAAGAIRQAAHNVNAVGSGNPDDFQGGVTANRSPLAGLGDTRHIAEQTQGGQALIDAWNGKRVDVGSGFFPDITSQTARAAGAAARAEAPTINGHAFTIGRGVASIFAPDTVPYNLLSGSIDAAVTLNKYNPGNVAFEPITRALGARGLVTGAQTPEEAQAALKISQAQDLGKRVDVAQRAVDSLSGQIQDAAAKPVGSAEGAYATLGEKTTQLGGLRDQLSTARNQLETIQTSHQLAQGFSDQAYRNLVPKTGGGTAAVEATGGTSSYRLAVDRPTAFEALNGDRMQNVIRTLTPVDSPAEIWRASGGKINPDITGELAAAKTPSETGQVFASHLGSDINPMPTVKTTGTGPSRIGDYLRASTIPNYQEVNAQRDLNDALPKIDAYLRNMKVPEAERNQVFDTYVRASTPGEFYNADMNFVTAGRKPMADEMTKVLTGGGLTPEQAQPIADNYASQHLIAYRDSLNSQHVGNTADIVSDTPRSVYATYKGPGGDQVVAHNPMLDNEFLSRNLILADPQEMRQLARHPAVVSLAKVDARAAVYESKINELQSKLSQIDAVPGGPTETGGLTAGETRTSLQDQLSNLQELQRKNNILRKPAAAEAGVGAVADSATQFFKRAKLVRAGYGLRRVTDGMLQMAAHGYSGPLTHPFHYAAIVAGSNPDSRLGRILDAASGTYQDFRNAVSHVGVHLPEAGASRALMNSSTGAILQDDKLMSESMQDSSMQDFLNLSGKNRAMMPQRMLAGFGTIPSTDVSAPQAWLEELSRLRKSGLASGILDRAANPEDAHQWFLNGAGRTFREDMATDPQFAAILHDESMARAHVDEIMARLNSSLGGERTGFAHPDLIDYIKTGRLNQASNNAADIVHGGYHQIAPEDLAGYRNFMPSQLRARAEMTLPGAIKAKHAFTQGVDRFLNWSATKPDNYLVRSPVWKQAYWEDPRGGVPLLHGFSSADVQARTIAEARQAGVSPDAIAQLERTPAHVGAGTITNPDEVHNLAGAFAARQSNTMLHNFAQRNQVFDSIRNVAPFGDAWKQIIQRWARAAALNPKVVLRLEQGVRSAQGAGIFTKDPTTGQEVFTLPGTQWLTKAVSGVPVPLQGSVDGLSMLGQVYPGVGPAVTIPTYYLQNKMGLGDPSAANDALHQVLFPYGTSGYNTNPIFGAVQQMLPNWLAHVSQMWENPTNSREYASTLQGALDYLASSGRYDLHGANAQSETSRMIADAHSAANTLELVRGAVAFFSPSAPIPKQVILDKHNQLQELMLVRNEYYAHQQKDGSTKAYQWLLDTYGPGVFTATTPWSTNPSGSIVPRTAAGYDFAAAHSWMAQVAPDVYGALVPETGQPDLTAYDMSFRNGTRVPANPADRIKLANNRLASYQYDKWAAANPNATTDERNAKKTTLKAGFPGYQDQPINYNKIPNEIAQLKGLVNDPRAAATPELAHTVQFIKQYLAFRDQAIKAGGTKTLKSNAAAASRDWLINTVAQGMYSQDAGFAKAWDTLLKYEFPKENTNFKNAGALGAGGPGAGGMFGPGQAPPTDPRFRQLPVGPAPVGTVPVGVFKPPVDAVGAQVPPAQAPTENQYATRDAAGNVAPGQALQAQFGDRSNSAQQTPVVGGLSPGGAPAGGQATSGTWGAFATDLLKAIGATDSPGNHQAVLTWMSAEQPPDSPNAAFNPLNIQAGDYAHNGTAGSGQYNFANWQAGVGTTAKFLIDQGSGQGRYAPILAALRSNASPQQILSAIQNSGWAGGGYGGGLPGLLGSTPLDQLENGQIAGATRGAPAATGEAVGPHGYPLGGVRPPPAPKKAYTKKGGSKAAKAPKKKSASKGYSFGR